MSGLRFPYWSEQDLHKLLDWHPTTPPLKAIIDYGAKFVQRLLYYTHADLWLSDDDKDWHYPLLVTLRQQGT